MTFSRRGVLGLGLGVLLARPAVSAGYPERPVRMILPFPAASATDGAARLIGEELRKTFGQAFIVENQAGADGIIATQAVKRSTPDGYTLLVSTNSAHGSNPSLYNTLPYDPERDFEPVGGLLQIPLMLLVRKDFPAGDMAGFVAVAKQRSVSQPLNYGSGNTSNQVAAELLKHEAGIDMVHVPYRGTPQALQDLMGGQIDVLIVDPYSASGFLRDGSLKAFAVTDTKRVPLFPDVPTMPEVGYKDVTIVTFAAVFAPARTPPAVTEALNKAINDALARPEPKEYIRKMGATPMPMTREELRSFVHDGIAHWGKLVALAQIPKR